MGKAASRTSHTEVFENNPLSKCNNPSTPVKWISCTNQIWN